MKNEEAKTNLEKLLLLYDDDDAGIIDFSIIRESIKVAIESLEKQIPIQVGYKQKQYGEYFYCPECRHTVKWIRDYEYCAYCGKAIEFPDLVSKDTNDLWLTEETLEGET